MKIIQIVNNLDYGGLESLVIQLSQRLNEKGHSSMIVCLQNKGGLISLAQKKGIKIVCLNKKERFDWLFILHLTQFLRREKPDIVHTHNLSPLIYGTLASRLAGCHCINTRHGRAEQKTHKIIWALNHFLVAVSHDAREEMMRHNALAPEKVKVVYNGIDLSRLVCSTNEYLKKDLRDPLNIASHQIVIGHIGRLAIEKDHANLLHAACVLIEEGHDILVLLVGDGALRQELKELAMKLKIDNHVRFLGFRDDIPELLSIMDIFVLCSTMEGVSLTLLEAMAASKVVITTNVGGNPEVVVDGENGLLVPVGDHKKLAMAIRYCIEKPKLRQELGQHARGSIAQKFNLESMTNGYLELYQHMVKK